MKIKNIARNNRVRRFFCFYRKIYVFICYLCALALHEAGHAIAAKRRGYAPESVSLGVMGAAMNVDCGGMKPGDEIIIAISGPLVNACLWLTLVAFWWLFPDVYFYTRDFALANAGCAFSTFCLPIRWTADGRFTPR